MCDGCWRWLISYFFPPSAPGHLLLCVSENKIWSRTGKSVKVRRIAIRRLKQYYARARSHFLLSFWRFSRTAGLSLLQSQKTIMNLQLETRRGLISRALAAIAIWWNILRVCFLKNALLPIHLSPRKKAFAFGKNNRTRHNGAETILHCNFSPALCANSCGRALGPSSNWGAHSQN